MDTEFPTGFNVSSEVELREITARISSFSADGARDYTNKLVEHLCLHSMAKLPPGFRRAGDIFKKLREITGVPLEYAQVLEALRRLAIRKEISERNVSNDALAEFRMETEQISSLSTELKTYRIFEADIFNEWKAEVLAKYPNLEEADFEELLEDLNIFSLKLYSQLSVQNAFLYYGGNTDLSEILENMNAQSLEEILSKRSSKISSIRAVELALFFVNPPASRQQYIMKQLNSFFALQMMQLDPMCAEIVSQQITGGVIYVDTNFIYRLLGINGNKELQVATERLIQKSQHLGFSVVVSPRTVEEYKRSLQTSYTRMMGSIPVEVARALEKPRLNEIS